VIILAFLLAIVSLAAVASLYERSRLRDRSWERREQAWEKERRELIDRIMYLTDRPWQLPPDIEDRAPEVSTLESDSHTFDPLSVMPYEVV